MSVSDYAGLKMRGIGSDPIHQSFSPDRQSVAFCGAGPEYGDPPPLIGQFRALSSIASHGRLKLRQPEFDIAGGGRREPAAFVPMPETTIDEEGGVPPAQNNIRFAGKVVTMKAET